MPGTFLQMMKRREERDRERGREVGRSMVVKMNSLCSKDLRA